MIIFLLPVTVKLFAIGILLLPVLVQTVRGLHFFFFLYYRTECPITVYHNSSNNQKFNNNHRYNNKFS